MSSAAMTSSTPTGKASSKSSKSSRIVVLRLKSSTLAKWPSSPNANKKESSTNSSNGTSSPTQPNGNNKVPDSPSAGTPDPSAAKAKVNAALKPGLKRTSSAATLDKPKGRPGPKKKPRLADGTIDRSNENTAARPAATTTTSAAHKLGPKANTGAINAGLRALDRTGKPCRKWGRKDFNLKSFTGVTWDIHSWRAPVRASSTLGGDPKDSGSSTDGVKPEVGGSSAVPSESSRGGDVALIQTNGIESSPAPIPV